MEIVRQILSWVVLVFFLLLIGRLVFDWVQMLAREWRPRGPLLVVAEVVYSVTDPPLRAIRKVVPPLRIGQIQLDLAFFILFLVVVLLRQVLA